MKRSERMWRVVVAALLALAVALVWPPAGSGSASPDTRGVQTAAQSNHDHGAPSGRHSIVHVDSNCDASGIGCCVMTVCHPGISADPQDMPLAATDGDTPAATEVRGVGRAPGVVLPPPRRVPV